LNAGLPELLGEWAKPRQVPIIHYSTDYVFDGSKQTPYTEEDRNFSFSPGKILLLSGEMRIDSAP
jgi:dTDP-4-dehydrorhamnose reductase